MIHFDFNMSTIKEQYYAILDEIAQILKERIPEASIILAGHTDSTGSDEFNQTLSERRANSTRDYLNKQGLAEASITAAGFGETMPVADNSTAAGRQKNRRSERPGD